MNLRLEKLDLPRYISPETDAGVLAALDIYTEILPADYGTNQRSRRALAIYEFNDRIPYVALDSENSVAAVANLNLNYRLKGSSFLEAVVVERSRREQGIGRFVIDRLAQVTANHGLERLRLQPIASPRVVGYYAGLGFRPDEIEIANPKRPFMSVDVASYLSSIETEQIAA